jgi:hypothetical protein
VPRRVAQLDDLARDLEELLFGSLGRLGHVGIHHRLTVVQGNPV